MISAAGTAVRGFIAAPAASPASDWLRSGLGALLGIAITTILCSLWVDRAGGLPALIAPMGASSVLLFAVPASPLAQPRAFIGGNLISAIIGVSAAKVIPDAMAAAAVAVALSIVLMAASRCLHPPSGAVALTAVLGGPHIVAAGYDFVLMPVLLNTVILLAVAYGYNKLVGRSYPHIPHPVAHPTPSNVQPRLSQDDYTEVLADYGERLAIGPEDLGQLFEELLARNRRKDG